MEDALQLYADSTSVALRSSFVLPPTSAYNPFWLCRCGRDQAYGRSVVACCCEPASAFDLSVNRASTPTPWYHTNHGNRAPALPGYDAARLQPPLAACVDPATTAPAALPCAPRERPPTPVALPARREATRRSSTGPSCFEDGWQRPGIDVLGLSRLKPPPSRWLLRG